MEDRKCGSPSKAPRAVAAMNSCSPIRPLRSVSETAAGWVHSSRYASNSPARRVVSVGGSSSAAGRAA
ncbi:hypothetical protein OHV05_28260 [Kitasatospora sp. NBC_00070]|uniref:hypothetical protein n=1 Tax=Kitasatospora sp. NBC_00070 TaxID=2975962 RepID=UPI00324A6116